MNETHERNRRKWNRDSEGWKALRDRDGLWRRCPEEPDLAFEGQALQFIRDRAGDLAGRDVCAIGSGDNYAAFALAGLGAKVTSTDISEKQLEVASGRAKELGLDMTFVRADAAGLRPLVDSSFDLVCSSNGFYVWISDVMAVFGAVHRVLRPGGHYVFYDIHPFQRPWKEQVHPIEMVKPYSDTGPYEDDEEGSCEHNWTLTDLLNPLVDSGLVLRQIAENSPNDPRFWEGHAYCDGKDGSLTDWKVNPRAGLPVWLTVAAQKPPGGRESEGEGESD
jgi:SAM-dependent methyltransferase